MSSRARIAAQYPDQSARVLLASPCNDDHFVLSGILKHPNWQWCRAMSCREAIPVLKKGGIAVLICERDQPDGCWRDLLDASAKLSAPPSLIVCSRLADERLWAEVLNLGGYDVLVKPFEPEEVLRAGYLAWYSWERRRAPTTGSMLTQATVRPSKLTNVA